MQSNFVQSTSANTAQHALLARHINSKLTPESNNGTRLQDRPTPKTNDKNFCATQLTFVVSLLGRHFFHLLQRVVDTCNWIIGAPVLPLVMFRKKPLRSTFNRVCSAPGNPTSLWSRKKWKSADLFRPQELMDRCFLVRGLRRCSTRSTQASGAINSKQANGSFATLLSGFSTESSLLQFRAQDRSPWVLPSISFILSLMKVVSHVGSLTPHQLTKVTTSLR
jgi:hypothetical protein